MVAHGLLLARGLGVHVDQRRRFPDREVARSTIFEYLEGFYNRRRLHSALSYQSPADYEEATMEGAAVA